LNRWQQIESLFQEALQRPLGDRDAWLRQACEPDADLHREVASLLANHRDAGAEHWAAAAAQLIVRPILLEPGQYVGGYQITSFIAAGGMGEVYHARDTKLKRDVALKVLPEAFARDAGQMVRFRREAEILASLNHPNIAHIYGVEEGALVMELVDGESPKGPKPFEEAAKIALQIADALEYAHERGVVHRDLKPSNIKITLDGRVKLLDFGLAKAFATDHETTVNEKNSRTRTTGATEAGVILGTVGYMSPEQASGKPVDKRGDIWSYGVVTWELLTGERLFDGETVSHTFADVLRAPIDFGRLPKETPAPICDLLERCLNRDVKSRLRDIGEARIALEKYLAKPSAALATNEAGSTASSSAHRRLLTWGLAGVPFLSTALFLLFSLLPPVPPRLVSRFTIDLPPDTTFTNLNGGTAPSPDGHYVVFTARGGSDKDKLWLRPLDSLEARPLPGTEGANFPFWSADSKSIAFIADLRLKRVNLQGGAPVPVCLISPGQTAMGGTWNRDGVILFPGPAGLLRVSISGGDPILLTTPDASRGETGHGFPQFLPDGKHFLYFVQSGDPNVAGIYIASLDHPEAKVQVLRTYTKAVYTEPVMAEAGYLLWLRDQTLWAQRFDAKQLRRQGDPVVVVQDVAVNAVTHRAAFWASDAGLLVYRTQPGETARLTWVNRDGTRGPELEQGYAPRLSPDGTRAVFHRPGGSAGENLWLVEFPRSVPTPLTFGAHVDGHVSFSHDGSQIAFSSDRDGGIFQIYRKDVNGGGQEVPLTGGPHDKRLTDWSRDDKFLLYYEIDPKTQSDLWVLPLDANRKPFLILQTPAVESKGQFSPDGKWITYDSNRSGNAEVYIRAFPSSSTSRYWQVSIGGGTDPRWRGNEIFYLSPEKKMMARTVRTSDTSVDLGPPQELFPTSLGGGAEIPYDVTADGQRFLLLSPPAEGRNSTPPLTVIMNWDAGLKK